MKNNVLEPAAVRAKLKEQKEITTSTTGGGTGGDVTQDNGQQTVKVIIILDFSKLLLGFGYHL